MSTERDFRFYPNQRFIDATMRKFTVAGAWTKPDEFLTQTTVEFFQDGTTKIIERPVEQIKELFRLGRLKWLEEHPKEIWPPITF